MTQTAGPAGVATPEGVRRRSITTNAALSFVGQVVSAVFTAGLTIFLARRLGSHEYGLLSLALGIAGLVLLPSDFGLSNSIARFVADHATQPSRIQSVMAEGLRLKFGAALVASAVMFALAGPIAGWYHTPGLAWPVRGLSVALFAQSMMMVSGSFVAVGRVDLQMAVNLSENILQTASEVALVLAGAGATGAAFGQAIGYLMGAALTLWLLVRLLGPGTLPRSARVGADFQRIAGYASALLIVDGAYTVFGQIDVLVIGAYLGASSVALFSAPAQMILFLGYPGAAVAAGVAPRLSAGTPGGPDKSAFMAGMRFLIVVQSLLTAFVLGWAGLMIKVALGGQYEHAAPVLRGLAPFVFLTGFGSLVSIGANYLGRARKRIPIALATMAINVIADLILVPRIGVVGASVGTDAGYALYVPAHLLLCASALDLDLRPLAKTFARASLAGAVTVAILVLFGESISGPAILVTAAGGLFGAALYVLVLWLTDELTDADLRRLSRRRRSA